VAVAAAAAAVAVSWVSEQTRGAGNNVGGCEFCGRRLRIPMSCISAVRQSAAGGVSIASLLVGANKPLLAGWLAAWPGRRCRRRRPIDGTTCRNPAAPAA